MNKIKQLLGLLISVSLMTSCNGNDSNPKQETNTDTLKNKVDIEKQSKDSTTLANTAKTIFVKGLTSATVYLKDQAEKGAEYNYKDGRTFRIECFFNQVDFIFYSHNENKQRETIDTKFEVGYSSDGEMSTLKNETKFLIGQYDFDADGIDELVIALQDNDEGENGITLNIFKLQNDKWNRIGTLTGNMILGEPTAEIKMNKIKVERHLRGFFYQWTLESGKFKDTGEY